MDAPEVIWGLLRILLAVALLAFGLYCCYIKSIHMKYDHIPGAPRVSFFLGHGPLIWKMVKNQEPLGDLFLQWAEEYGPVVRFNVLHKAVVLVLSPEGVKECLLSPQYPKDQEYERTCNIFGERFLGNGLVSDLDHARWYKQRRIMDVAFSRSYLTRLMGTFNDQADKLMEQLEGKADGKTAVDMLSLLSRVTLDIIAKVAFGLELNTVYDDQTPFPRAIYMTLQGLSKSRIPFFEYMPWNRKEVKGVQESIRLLRRTGKECIEQRRKDMQDGEEIPLDILTQILKGAAQEEGCNDELMLDNFVTFFVAGHDTTTTQLSFTIMELSRNPEVVAKLQAEVDDVIGVKRDIAYEDLGKLQCLSQVLKEALRLYSPVPTVPRWTRKETVFEGVKIPANTTLMFSQYVMGRMKRFFKDPLIFNPDRFSKDQTIPYFTYFPFSLGGHTCIGQLFSQMEAKVVMAKFLQRFEFQLVPPQSFKIMETASLKPLDGLVCRLRPRRHLRYEGD
uniref:Cholesterol 24-hydroxylase n=1 Tax=Podarcis muralis TaxID=64176 RepID=A0A670HVS7_PODMU